MVIDATTKTNIDAAKTALNEESRKRYTQLVRKRAHPKGKITEFVKLLAERSSVDVAKIIANELPKIEEKFDAAQSVLDDEFEAIEALYDEREEFENRLMNLKLDLEAVQSSALSQSQATQHLPQAMTSRIQLPPAQLPKFDGRSKNWLSFKKLFTSMVGERQDLDESNKFYYLQSACIEGQAIHIVNATNDSTYTTAMSKLEEKYGNHVLLKQQLVAELYNIEAPSPKSAKSLLDFVTRIESCRSFFSSVDIDIETWSPLLLFHLSTKLDIDTRKEVERNKNPNELMNIEQFLNVIKSRAQMLELETEAGFKPKNTSTPVPRDPLNKRNQFTKQQSLAAVPSASTNKGELKPCSFCDQKHSVFQCAEFTKLSEKNRYFKVRSLSLCFNCLKGGHGSKECSASKCQKCGKPHHTLLHRTQRSDESSLSSNDSKEEHKPDKANDLSNEENKLRGVTTSATIHQTNMKIVVLATAIIWIENSHGEKVPCRALNDSGSTVCFITENMTQTLGLKKTEVNTTVSGINNHESCNKYKVTTSITSRVDSSYTTTLDFLITRKITSDLPLTKFDTTGWHVPNSDQLADPNFNTPSRIDVLLGAEVFFDVLIGQKQQICNNLWMYASKLGTLIVGTLQPQENHQMSFVTIAQLKNLVQKFWETEAVENKYCHTMEEKAAEKHYVQNVKQLDNGHYEVALPFNNLITQLGDSSLSSKRIYLAAERRLERQPEKKYEYDQFIQEMLDMNHLEVAPLESHSRIYYMTHHLIARPTSTTTKYRVVFNASHRTNTGISLNQALMVGPTIQSEIFIHLIYWRQFPIALTSDAEKMYRQVYVREADRDFQRIWYRFNKNEPLQSYRVTRVTYGTASAPFLATRTLKQLADDQILKYPDVAPCLAEHVYVDDYTSSHATIQAAVSNKTRLMQLAKEGGFTFRKWASNEVTLDDDPDKIITSVLGVTWNKKDDTIILSFEHVKIAPLITKSTVLSEIASMFDPLGLCSPIVMRAKLFMQRLWSFTEYNWDEPLHSELIDEWTQFRQQLNEMKQITIPRRLIIDKAFGITLHGFCDASKDGYGACIYLVNGSNSQLICSKSRVAPIKPTTIPRLELNAAVLLSKLMSKIIPTFQHTIKDIYNWSDSEINVFRIKSAASKFNVYVGTRIGDIQERTNPLTWRHLKSADNPADFVSRGVAPTDLQNLSIWWHGPKFILEDEENWPTQNKFDAVNKEIDLELKKQVALIAVNSFLDDFIHKMSSWKLAKLAIGYCLRFITNARKPVDERNFDQIKSEEIFDAELRLIKLAQHEVFSNELNVLNKLQSVPASSRIFNLHPFIDSNQLLRVGGRLGQSDFDYDKKHQIIVPTGRLSKLILRQLHVDNLHCGPQMLLSTSRQRFWILGARSQCRSVVQNCVICFKTKPILMQQLMGDVHKARLDIPTHPFLNVGIDFAGPFFIRPQPRSKVSQKNYVAVFTCFVTRCVHLEVVIDLSTSAFLQCFRRFLARRGIPKYISTDNATNFIGARSELKQLKEMFFSEQNLKEVKRFCADRLIKWLTIPARSPHWGGLWESIVKQMKYHLKRSTKDKIFNPDEFSTLIIQIEGALNSRPLTHISSSVDDYDVITPGHFLIGRPLNTLPEPSYSEIPDNRLVNWQQMQKLRSKLWQRFQQDYFHELQTRAKWKKEFPDVKVGTVVLIHEDTTPPNYWKLGRIHEIYKGTDNHVRAVLLKTPDGTFKRSIVKIAPLPLNED